MVDWSLARQVADLSAGADDPGRLRRGPRRDLRRARGPGGGVHGPRAGRARARARAREPLRVGVGQPRLAGGAARPGGRAPRRPALVRGPARGRPASGRRGHGGRRGRARDGLRLAPRARPVRRLAAGRRPAAAPAVRGAQPEARGERHGRRALRVRALDLRPRAHPRLPVPGRALAARAHVVARARVPRVRGGADRSRRRRRPPLDARARAGSWRPSARAAWRR